MSFKALKGILKIVPNMLKALPLAVKALIFLVVKLPKLIFNTIKNVFNFIKKAIPLAFAVILSYLLIFFGIQYLFTELTGMSLGHAQVPLAIFTLYIIYELVMRKTDLLKLFQKYLLKGFLFIFNNPLVKDLVGFNVKVDKRNPAKSFINILKWISNNIVKIVISFFFMAFMLKISIGKIWQYITFYTE